MSRHVLFALLAAAPVALTHAATAQSSLGLNFAEAQIALTSDGGSARPTGRVLGDYRISAAQGVQFGLTAYDMSGGWVGQVDAHLYLQPQDDRKYGFYLSLADIDDRAGTIATGGVEAMWSPRPGTTLTASAGAGLANDSRDFLTLTASAERALSDRVTVFADLGITDIDEADISARLLGVSVGLRHDIPGTGLEISAALAADRMDGPDSRPTDSRIKIGVAMRLGAERGARRAIDSRAFETMHPLDAMIARGLF